MTPGDWKLVALALVSIGVLVLLVTRIKVNAFIALAAAALVVGTGSVFWLRVPARTASGAILKAADGTTSSYTMLNVVESFTAGLGGALGGVTAMVVLGTMLGKLLAESGGAEVLAQRFIDFFGPKRIQLCIMALALTIGLTTWFAVGLVLLAPIVLTLTHRTKQPFLLLFLPLLSCLSVMHGVMPPHPGPVIASKELAVDMGRVLFWGFIIGIPTAAVAGPIYARFIVKRVHTEAPAVPDKSRSLEPGRSLPGFGITMFTIILPVGLMLISTAAELILPKGDHLRESLSFIGGPFMALLIAVVFASWSLGLRCGYTGSQVLKFTEVAVASIGMTLVVIGAGGGFARVLRDSGVAESIGHFGASAKLSPLLFGWVISAFIRVATGSATVAMVGMRSDIFPETIAEGVRMLFLFDATRSYDSGAIGAELVESFVPAFAPLPQYRGVQRLRALLHLHIQAAYARLFMLPANRRRYRLPSPWLGMAVLLGRVPIIWSLEIARRISPAADRAWQRASVRAWERWLVWSAQRKPAQYRAAEPLRR